MYSNYSNIYGWIEKLARLRIIRICVFTINDNLGADICPIVDLGYFGRPHVDTAVTHGSPKIIVPISAMNAIANPFGDFFVVEKQDIRDIGKIIVGAKFLGSAGHLL